MRKKLFHYILNDPVHQYPQTGYQKEGIGSRCIQNCFYSEILTLSCRGGIEETKLSQKCSLICIYHSQKQPITCPCMLIQQWFLWNTRQCLAYWESKEMCIVWSQMPELWWTDWIFHRPPLQYIQAISNIEDVVLQVTHRCII